MFLRFINTGYLRNAEGGGGMGGGGGDSGGGSSAGGDGGGSSSSGAPSTASAFVGAGGGSSGAEGGEGSSSSKGAAKDAAGGDGDGAAPKKPPSKYKVKRDGQEREYTTEELVALASDDAEDELTIDGAKVRKKRAEILRDAQLGGAAFKRMQEAAGIKKTYGEKLELLNKDTRKFLEEHVADGDDKEDRLEKIATEILKDRYELAALKKKDPDAYIRKIEERKAARAQAQQEAKAQQEARAAQQEAHKKKMGERIKALPAAFEALGLKPTGLAGLAVRNLFETADAQGYDLAPEHAAGMVRDALRNELRGWLGKLEGASLLDVLGEDVAKKIRAAEVKRLSGGKSEAKDAATSDGEPKPPRRKEKEPLTEEQWRQKHGGF